MVAISTVPGSWLWSLRTRCRGTKTAAALGAVAAASGVGHALDQDHDHDRLSAVALNGDETDRLVTGAARHRRVPDTIALHRRVRDSIALRHLEVVVRSGAAVVVGPNLPENGTPGVPPPVGSDRRPEDDRRRVFAVCRRRAV